MDSAKELMPRTNNVFGEMVEWWENQMKLNLKAKRKRVSIRSTWKKIGKGWQPKKVTKKTFRGNYVASGTLLNSIKTTGEGFTRNVEMERYGEAIIKGRKPWRKAKGKGNKGIPIKDMNRWIKQNKMKPRDMATGQFIPKTASNMKAMSFMMNRKIKHFGIEPFDFVGISADFTTEKYRSQLRTAMKLDIETLFKNEL